MHYYCFQVEGNWCTTVLRRRQKEKITGVLLLSVKGNWCYTVFRIRDLVLYCSQEQETGALLFSRIRDWCSTVFERRAMVLYQVYWSTVIKVSN